MAALAQGAAADGMRFLFFFERCGREAGQQADDSIREKDAAGPNGATVFAVRLRSQRTAIYDLCRAF
jgi:hypothetical protein